MMIYSNSTTLKKMLRPSHLVHKCCSHHFKPTLHTLLNQRTVQSSSVLPYLGIAFSSSVVSESLVDDADTFGNLKDKKQKHRFKTKKPVYENVSPKNVWNRKMNKFQQFSEPINKVSTSRNKEDVVEKWYEFRDKEFSQILRNSQTVMDDSEDEYDFFKTEKKNNNDCTDINYGKKSEHLQNTDFEFEMSEQENEFGTLSPYKNSFETIEPCERDKREEEFHRKKTGIKHSVYYYGLRMKNLCKDKKLKEALKILEEEMPNDGVKPNKFCFNVLINGCGKVGYTKKAFQLYNQMKKRGLEVDGVVYTGLFNACANSPWPTTDGLTRARQLYTSLAERQYLFNTTHYHVMIKAFGRCGDIEMAFTLVDRMLEQGLMISTATFNFLLQACISDKEAGFRHAIKAWNKMRALHLNPDIYSYNLMVRCIKECKAGDPKLLNQLLDLPKVATQPKRGLIIEKRPSSRIHKTKLDIPVISIDENYANDQGNTKEECLHEKDQEDGIQNSDKGRDLKEKTYKFNGGSASAVTSNVPAEFFPNLIARQPSSGQMVAMSSLDKAHERLTLVGGSVGFLEQIHQDKVKPSIVFFTQLLDCLPPDTQAEEALISEMQSLGVKVDISFCNMLIRRRCFRTDAEAVKAAQELIQAHHLYPDIITFGCLALGCKKYKEGLQLLEDIKETGFRPNNEILHILLKNSCIERDYHYTMNIMNVYTKECVTPSVNTLQCLEKARIVAKARAKKLESWNDLNVRQQKELKQIQIFISFYKTWLLSSSVQLEEFPWAQYRDSNDKDVKLSNDL
ncbi:pentatricopeptide repeat-containing protein 1, mitochondrial isoform X2 [Oratosquilla oratoria]|uniref:pentatricopeptide repeat-containing protein 1, mitochondrial isoform X2 n=1 Tax=Oratosquilla oratoria TaxID=337810 RepID=UPI003F7727D3